MACYRLRSYDQSPPGGFPYEQTQGIYKKFRAEPLIEAIARNVAAWRQANNLPRSSLRESLEDVDQYQCRRLGNPGNFCVSCDGNTTAVALNNTSPMIAKPCGGCGAPVQ